MEKDPQDFGFSKNMSVEQTKQIILKILVAGALLSLAWIFWGFRVNVPPDHVLVLIKKFGTASPSGRIIAEKPGQQGIQYKVLSEGWHWYNSITWQREIHPAVKIAPSTFGVLIRRYGKTLEEGQILANNADFNQVQKEDTRGIIPEILKPGKYNINPYAYRVERFPVFEVPAGHVGIVIDKIGKDQDNFEYLSQANHKGIQPEVKEPGTWYLNPYMYDVIAYNIRKQKTDFEGQNSLSFMSDDSFDVNLTATVEWAVERSRVPEVFVRIGALNEVERKIIQPFARSYVRMIGSESKAKDYISGESRQSIQGRLQELLKERCEKLGIRIYSVLIRKIIPPRVLTQIISTRGLEKEKRNKLTKEIEKVKSDAQVAKYKEEIKKSQAKVEENISKQKRLTKIKGDRVIALKHANKRIAIGELNLQAAKVNKETIVEKGRAEILQEFNIKEAEVDQLAAKVKSMGSGKSYSRYILNQKLQIESLLTSDKSSLAVELTKEVGGYE